MRRKEIAGEPATQDRALIRRQCKPRGPIGHLLDTIHMQAASMDEESPIWQNDQIPVQLIKAPYQQVAGMIATMAMRNRTRAAANTRNECEYLYERQRSHNGA